jgi:S1-C subfamily serine protease
MSQSLYPVTREHPPQRHAHHESPMTKVLALLLLLVAGALVFMVYQQRRQKQEVAVGNYEPKPIAQRPDDKLGADEQATIDVFEKFSRSVVNVTNLTTRRNFRTMNMDDIPQGTGSGFVRDQQGHIVTNFHVVENASRASVTLNDGVTYEAKIVGTAPDKDIAVLQIDAPASKLVPLPVGQSANLKVGQKVLAIGNPFGTLAGLDRTLTTGVISGLGREIKSVTGRPISDVIQTDASINPGNSGGPLLDSAGRLIGINTAIYSPTGASAGIGFAVPVDIVNLIVPQLIRDGKIVRPGLGVNILNDALATQHGIDGVAILQVQQGGAADRAGLQGLQSVGGQNVLGDVIVKIDGKDVHKSTDLFKALDPHKVGDTVDVTVENQNNKRSVKVTLQPVQ